MSRAHSAPLVAVLQHHDDALEGGEGEVARREFDRERVIGRDGEEEEAYADRPVVVVDPPLADAGAIGAEDVLAQGERGVKVPTQGVVKTIKKMARARAVV